MLLRPSYILSGTAMRVAHNSVDLDNDFETACIVSRDYPVVMSKFVIGGPLYNINRLNLFVIIHGDRRQGD